MYIKELWRQLVAPQFAMWRKIANNIPGKLIFISLNLPEHYSRVYGTLVKQAH